MMIQSVRYSIDVIQEEVRHLVKKGLVSRRQPIYNICEYIPVREWQQVERELESHGFLPLMSKFISSP
jgi:uncharacterized protein YqgQ